MPQTLTQLTVLLRAKLNEATAAAWSDTDLAQWLNEGAREVARSTMHLETSATFSAVAGTQQYTPVPLNAPTGTPTPGSVIMINRLEYVPTGTTTSYPIEYADFNNLDQVWWTGQTQQQGTPMYFSCWGMVPNLKIVLYPTPSQAGTFTCYFWRYPATMASSGDVLEVPEGWHDVVVDYAAYMALLRDSDDRWQQYLQMFTERLDNLLKASQRHTPHTGGIDTWSASGNALAPFAGGW